MEKIMSKEEFEKLTPRQRGYIVYMLGMHEEQTNVPNEKNPYVLNSVEWSDYINGQHSAILDAQDD